MAECERHADFSFAFDCRDHSNRVLTLRFTRGGVPAEETLFVNTAILGKESEYFRRYFSGGFVETWQVAGCTDARGISVDDLSGMLLLLRAIYAGGQLPSHTCEDPNTLLRVLMLADEYRVPAVIASCARALQRATMTLALAVEVLILPQHIQEIEVAKNLLVQARRCVEKTVPCLDSQIAVGQGEIWQLPLQAMECLLASPRVKVQSEDTVFFLILEWAKRNLPGRSGTMGKVGGGGGVGSVPDMHKNASGRLSGNIKKDGGQNDGEDSPVESVGIIGNYNGQNRCRAEALKRLWSLLRLPRMSAECLLALRTFSDAADYIDSSRVEEAIRIRTMDPRAVVLLYGSAPPYSPRPGKPAGPTLLTWQVHEKDIIELNGMKMLESSERVFVCGNWYCIELRKTGLGTLFDNTIQIRLAERDCGPPGHPFKSIKGKRVVEASCTVGTPPKTRMYKGLSQLVCFGELPSPSNSPTKADSKLNLNPNPNIGELTVGSKLWGPLAKENNISSFGPKLNELTWDLATQRYIHPLVGYCIDESGNLQITIAFQPLSAWV